MIEQPEDFVPVDQFENNPEQDPQKQDPAKPVVGVKLPPNYDFNVDPYIARSEQFAFGPQLPRTMSEIAKDAINAREQRLDQEREARLMQNFRESVNTDYHAYQEAKQIATSLGITVDQAMNDMDAMRIWAAERAFRQSNLERNAPVIARMMEDREKARDIAMTYNQFSYWERTLMAWEHGGMTFDRGMLGMKIRDGVATEEEKKQYEELNERIKYFPAPTGEILPEAFRFFAQQYEMLPYTIGAGLAAGGTAAAATAVSGPGAVPAFFSSYFWASNATSAYLMYQMEAGNAFMNMIESGMDPESAKKYSSYYGLVAAAVEFGLGPIADVGVRRFIVGQAVDRIFSKEVTAQTAKAFFATPTARGALAQGALDYGKSLIIEPTEEWLQAKTEEMFTELAKLQSSPQFQAAMRAEGNWEEKASEAADAFYNAFWGMIVGGAVPGGMSAVGQTMSIQAQAKKAQDNAQKIKDLIDHVKKTGTKDPNVVKDVTARLVEAHGPAELGVTVGDLQAVLLEVSNSIKTETGQEVDVRALLKQHFPEIESQLESASKVGLHGMIIMKTDEFVTKVATTNSEFGTMLLKHLRVLNDGVAIPMSLGEAVKELKMREEMRQKAAEIYEKEEAPFRESVGQVKKTIADQFKQNTTLSENEIATVTNLLAARAVVFAKAEGILPMQWLERTGGSVAQVGKSMTQEEFDIVAANAESLKANRPGVLQNIKVLERFGMSEEVTPEIDAAIESVNTIRERIDELNNLISEESIQLNLMSERDFQEMQAATLGKDLEQLLPSEWDDISELWKKSDEYAALKKLEEKHAPKIAEAKNALDAALKNLFSIPGAKESVVTPELISSLLDSSEWAQFWGYMVLSDVVNDESLFKAYPEIATSIAIGDIRSSELWKMIPGGKIIGKRLNAVAKKGNISIARHLMSFKDFANIIRTEIAKYVNKVEGKKIFDTIAGDSDIQAYGKDTLKYLFSSTPTQGGLVAAAAFIPHLNRIILSKDATLRDVLHEVGHFMFEDLVVNASKPGASAREVEIANTLFEWLGVVGDEKESAFVKWSKLTTEEKSARHEIFAYSWEGYLEKGEAPTPQLRKVFRYFGMVLRQFWRTLKSDPRVVYKKAYGKDLPILSSPAAKAMAMMLSIEDDMNRHQVAIDMSTGFMTKEEATAAGVTDTEWNDLMDLRRMSVAGAVDDQFTRRLKGAGRIRRMFGRFADRLNDQFQQIFNAVLGEEKAKLVKERVHNARRWLATGTLSTDAGDVSLAQGAGENTHKLNRKEVLAVYEKLKSTLEVELKEVKAMRDSIAAANSKDPQLADYDNYIAVIKGVIKIGSAPIMATASKILTVGRKGVTTAEKAVGTFVTELTNGVLLQNMRTVKRSPLYVFKDIRGLSAAKDDQKLNRSNLEAIVYDMIVNNEFDFNIELKSVDAALAGKREAEGIVWSYANNRDQLFDAILIALYKKALATEKGKLTKQQKKKIEEAEAKYEGAVADYFRFVKTQEEQARTGELVAAEEPTVKLHNALINAAIELRNAQTKVLKASVSKEKLEEINIQAYEKLKVEFPEFAGEKLTKSDVNASVRDAVHRRLASKVVDKFFDSRKREMVSESGRDVDGYVSERGGFASAKDFIKAIVSAKSELEVAQERTADQMKGKYRDAASSAHVTAGAKQVIESMMQESNVSDALDGMLHDDGISLEFARTRFGYKSDEDMLFDLLTADDIDEVAEAKAEERMQSEYAELTDPKERDRLISESVHNEIRAEAIASEIQLVNRALRRAYDQNLPEEERQRRQAEADEYERQANELLLQKENLRKRAEAARNAGDYATAQSLIDQAELASKQARKLFYKANRPLALMAEVRRAAKEAAIDRMDSTLVRHTNIKASTVSASKARAAAKRSLEAAMKAKGEDEIDLLLEYIEHKHQELVAHYMIAEAHKAEAQMRRDKDLISDIFGNTAEIGGKRTIEFVFAARAIAIIFGMRSGNVDAAIATIEKIRETDPALHAHIAMLVSGSIMMATKASQDAMQLIINDTRTRPGPTVSRANISGSKDLYKNMVWKKYQEMMQNIRWLWETAKKLESQRALNEEAELEADIVQATDNIIKRTELEKEAKTKLSKLAFWRRWNKKPDHTNKYGREDIEIKTSQTMDWMARNERLESLFLELDNNKYGFFTKTFFRPIAEKSVAYRARMAEFNKRFADIIKPIRDKLLEVGEIDAYELKNVDTGKTYVFGKGGNLGFDELFWILQHIGNQGNYKRMIVGMGWGKIDKKTGVLDDSAWVAFYERMKSEGIITDDVLQVMQNIWDEFESIRVEFKKAWRETMGIPTNDVEATEVAGVNKKFRGGYMPAKVDGPIVTLRADQASLDDIINATEVGMLQNSPSVPLGRGLDRSENYEIVADRLKVGHTLVLSAMDEQLRFIHLHSTIKRLAQILRDRRVTGALNAYNPSLLGLAMIPWLKDIALQSSSKGGPFAQFFRDTREIVISVTMFANVKAFVENISGFMPVLNELGVSKGLPALLANASNVPGFMSEVLGFAVGKSEWFSQNVKAPLLESYLVIEELLRQDGKIGDIQKWMKNNSSFLNKLSQIWVSSVAWKASYDSDMAGLVNEIPDAEEREKEAIARADSRVRLTQGSYNIEDRTALERGQEFTKALVALGSWSNVQRLGAKRNMKQAVIDHGWIGGLPQMSGAYATIIAIPAIFSATVAAYLYGKFDDDDPEKRSELMTELLFLSQLRMISSGFPVIGNTATSLATMMDDKPYDDSLISGAYVGVMARAAKSAASAVKDAISSNEDVKGKDLRMIIDFILGGLRVPTVGRQISYLYALARGEEKPKDMEEFVRGFLTGKYSSDK